MIPCASVLPSAGSLRSRGQALWAFSFHFLCSGSSQGATQQWNDPSEMPQGLLAGTVTTGGRREEEQVALWKVGGSTCCLTLPLAPLCPAVSSLVRGSQYQRLPHLVSLPVSECWETPATRPWAQWRGREEKAGEGGGVERADLERHTPHQTSGQVSGHRKQEGQGPGPGPQSVQHRGVLAARSERAALPGGEHTAGRRGGGVLQKVSHLQPSGPTLRPAPTTRTGSQGTHGWVLRESQEFPLGRRGPTA